MLLLRHKNLHEYCGNWEKVFHRSLNEGTGHHYGVYTNLYLCFSRIAFRNIHFKAGIQRQAHFWEKWISSEGGFSLENLPCCSTSLGLHGIFRSSHSIFISFLFHSRAILHRGPMVLPDVLDLFPFSLTWVFLLKKFLHV